MARIYRPPLEQSAGWWECDFIGADQGGFNTEQGESAVAGFDIHPAQSGSASPRGEHPSTASEARKRQDTFSSGDFSFRPQRKSLPHTHTHEFSRCHSGTMDRTSR